MAFASSDARFRALIEAAPDPIGVFRDGLRIYANPALVRFLGYDSAEQLLGRNIREVFHSDDHALLDERNLRRARGEKLDSCDYRMLHRSGAVLVAEMTSIGIELDDGPAVLVTMRDRTEHRRLEAELRQAERLASVGALAAAVAHEINNPLAYVLANLDMALARDLPPDALRELLQAAREGAERVRVIASDLRTLARADDQPEKPVEIAAAADAAVTITSPQLRGIEIRREHEANVCVRGNEGRLVQVLANLLINAAQADALTIRIRTRAEGELAAIEVEDDGHGVAKEVLPHVFERFFSTKPRELGTGLGLPIAKDLVEAMGGTIELTSEGRGAVVRIRLPRAERTSTPEATSSRRRARILVVDDEPAIGRALTLALGDVHDVIAVHGGVAAIDLLARDGSFDVILCDVTMPDLTGPAVFERLPTFADRFVFITGGTPDRATDRALIATGRPVLQKPFSMSDVESLVRDRPSA
ncbi:MAG: hybrid sensor histidine kinase/response regulator [Polyangiales bacterium]